MYCPFCYRRRSLCCNCMLWLLLVLQLLYYVYVALHCSVSRLLPDAPPFFDETLGSVDYAFLASHSHRWCCCRWCCQWVCNVRQLPTSLCLEKEKKKDNYVGCALFTTLRCEVVNYKWNRGSFYVVPPHHGRLYEYPLHFLQCWFNFYYDAKWQNSFAVLLTYIFMIVDYLGVSFVVFFLAVGYIHLH